MINRIEQLEDENLELAVANENLLKENRVYKNRVQQLEVTNKDNYMITNEIKFENLRLEEQNKRYREALEKIFINQTQVPTKYEKTGEIARKALEESP